MAYYGNNAYDDEVVDQYGNTRADLYRSGGVRTDTPFARHLDKNGNYTVQAGDSLASISQLLYGDQRMMQALSEFNGGVMMLHPGDKLGIPNKPSNVVVTDPWIASDVDKNGYARTSANSTAYGKLHPMDLSTGPQGASGNKAYPLPTGGYANMPSTPPGRTVADTASGRGGYGNGARETITTPTTVIPKPIGYAVPASYTANKNVNAPSYVPQSGKLANPGSPNWLAPLPPAQSKGFIPSPAQSNTQLGGFAGNVQAYVNAWKGYAGTANDIVSGMKKNFGPGYGEDVAQRMRDLFQPAGSAPAAPAAKTVAPVASGTGAAPYNPNFNAGVTTPVAKVLVDAPTLDASINDFINTGDKSKLTNVTFSNDIATSEGLLTPQAGNTLRPIDQLGGVQDPLTGNWTIMPSGAAGTAPSTTTGITVAPYSPYYNNLTQVKMPKSNPRSYLPAGSGKKYNPSGSTTTVANSVLSTRVASG
jgi:hypothetical protein